MKTICILPIIISLCYTAIQSFAAYENGYAAGFRNDTITTACIVYTGTAKWNDCDNGFNDDTALRKTTLEYGVGFQIAKNDSVIGLYDAKDACTNYRTMPKPVAKMGTAMVTTVNYRAPSMHSYKNIENRQCLKRGLHQALQTVT